jgi:hypothetical protein
MRSVILLGSVATPAELANVHSTVIALPLP